MPPIIYHFFTPFCSYFFFLDNRTSFIGHNVTNEYENASELQHSFQLFDVYRIDVKAFDEFVKGAGNSMVFNMDLGDEYNWDISLEPRDMRKPGHLRRWATNGGIKEMPPTENITFRGKLQAPEGGSVSLVVDDELIRGFIKNDGEMYYIEPVWYYMKDVPRDIFVVYAVSNVQPHPDVKCGATMLQQKTEELLNDHEQDHDHADPQKSMICYEIEISIASDWLMF